jgi:hypothetical protein
VQLVADDGDVGRCAMQLARASRSTAWPKL